MKFKDFLENDAEFKSDTELPRGFRLVKPKKPAGHVYSATKRGFVQDLSHPMWKKSLSDKVWTGTELYNRFFNIKPD